MLHHHEVIDEEQESSYYNSSSEEKKEIKVQANKPDFHILSHTLRVIQMKIMSMMKRKSEYFRTQH
jgi:hypothetical protein